MRPVSCGDGAAVDHKEWGVPLIVPKRNRSHATVFLPAPATLQLRAARRLKASSLNLALNPAQGFVRDHHGDQTSIAPLPSKIRVGGRQQVARPVLKPAPAALQRAFAARLPGLRRDRPSVLPRRGVRGQ